MSELSFNTKSVRHEFLVDGVKYYLPGITIGDLEAISALTDMPPKERIAAFRELMASRVKRVSRFRFWQKSGRIAVYSMQVAQVSGLFNLWKPGAPGESSASRDK